MHDVHFQLQLLTSAVLRTLLVTDGLPRDPTATSASIFRASTRTCSVGNSMPTLYGVDHSGQHPQKQVKLLGIEMTIITSPFKLVYAQQQIACHPTTV